MSDSDEKPTKKVSDVIVELDAKMGTLIKLMTNMNTNMTLVLSRLNEAAKQQQSARVVMPETPPESPLEFAEEVSSYEPIPVTERPVQMRRSPTSRTQTVPSDKKVPVYQEVTDGNDKVIFLADVEVITESKTLVVKTKTTAAGKWQAALKPGKYLVHILKKENDKRKRMEFRKEFVVEESDSPIQLPKAVLKEIS